MRIYNQADRQFFAHNGASHGLGSASQAIRQKQQARQVLEKGAMVMHFCGNPFHDVPLYIVLALPFLAPVLIWLRARFGRQKCDCGHEHEHGEKHP